MIRKVIIDTDPGIDDAVAIMALARHPEVEILGICSVAGNVSLSQTTKNSCKLNQRFNLKSKVYKGPIDLSFPNGSASEVHGDDGLGNLQQDDHLEHLSEQNAVDFILEEISKYPGEVDIIALGPLTNIAECIKKDKETMLKTKSIVSMGGAVHSGNVTPVAEFNYWFDPQSVETVYSQLGEQVPITMVGLDATQDQIIDMNDLTFISYQGEDGQWIMDMIKPYLKYYWEKANTMGVVIHDLVAVIVYLYPDVVVRRQVANLRCVVDGLAHGQCLVDSWKLPKNADVILELDQKMFKEVVMKALFGEEANEKYITLRKGA